MKKFLVAFKSWIAAHKVLSCVIAGVATLAIITAIVVPVSVSAAKKKASKQDQESGEKGGGEGSGGSKASALKNAINATRNYKGSCYYEYTMPMGLYDVTQKATYDSVTRKYATNDSGNINVVIPKENDLSTHYYKDASNSAKDYFQIVSSSYADEYGAYILAYDESTYLGLNGFSAIAEAEITGKAKDMFKKYELNELNEGMLNGNGVNADPSKATTSLVFEEENGITTATYTIKVKAEPIEGVGYPNVDVDYVMKIKYNDKVVYFEETNTMNMHMNETSNMTQSMYVKSTFDYMFNEEFYNSSVSSVSSVTKNDGIRQNYFKAIINGYDTESYYPAFNPNEMITLAMVTSVLNSSYFYYFGYAYIVGIYTDPEYTQEFTPHQSKEAYEVFYVKASADPGHTYINQKNITEVKKGNLPFTDEEYELYSEYFNSSIETSGKLDLVSNSADCELASIMYSENTYETLRSMTFDGDAFENNIISKEMLASKGEHELICNFECAHGDGNSGYKPMSFASRVVTNSSKGVIIATTFGSTTCHTKLNTADFVKESLELKCKAYKSNKLLAKGEELDEGAIVVLATIKYIVGDDTLDALPEDYSGEFILQTKLAAPDMFVYYQLY